MINSREEIESTFFGPMHMPTLTRAAKILTNKRLTVSERASHGEKIRIVMLKAAFGRSVFKGEHGKALKAVAEGDLPSMEQTAEHEFGEVLHHASTELHNVVQGIDYKRFTKLSEAERINLKMHLVEKAKAFITLASAFRR